MSGLTVYLSGVPFGPWEQSGSRWNEALAEQYRVGGHAVCACVGRGAKKLAIRAYRTGSYGLARFPGSGEEHASSCGFYAASPEKSGLRCYGPALSEGADGTLRLQLPLGLSLSEPSLRPALDMHSGGPGRTQARMTLLGLLHLLWQEAGLNTWWPRMEGKRHIGLVIFLLYKTASGIRCGRSRLETHLLIGAADAEHFAAVRSRFDAAASLRCRLLTPMVLPRWSEESELRFSQGTLTGRPFHGLPRLELSQGLWDATARRFPVAISHWRKGGRVVALLQHEPLARRSSRVVALALMAVTEQWIPIESSHEMQLANLLVQERRAFSKPLRFDAAAEEVFPDFILLDARNGRQVPMEVFGLTHEAYLARKAQKTAYYDRVFGVRGWWSWDATSQPMPELPGR